MNELLYTDRIRLDICVIKNMHDQTREYLKLNCAGSGVQKLKAGWDDQFDGLCCILLILQKFKAQLISTGTRNGF